LRVHTAAITAPSALLGYLLAGGPLVSFGSVLWLAFGVTYHAAGFLDNNLQDYKYDVKDPSKGMFPLGREISYQRAQKIALGLHIFGIAFAVALARSIPALFIFGSMYAFGLLYNRTNKTSPFAGIWIALCFGPMGLFSYYATVGSNPAPIVLALTSFGLLQVYFQNAVSGSMKDIESDDYNIFKRMGVGVVDATATSTDTVIPQVSGLDTPLLYGWGYEPKRYSESVRWLKVPIRAQAFALAVKVAGIVPLYVLLLLALSPLGIVGPFVFTVAVGVTMIMMKPQTWDNRKTVRRASVIEITTFYAGVTGLAGAIGYWSVAFVIVFSLAWFVLLNRLTWGTSITPRV
jgi:hypothetical protein